MDIQNNWWVRTTCGISLLNEVVSYLDNDESVLILGHNRFPWFDEFSLELRKMTRNAKKTFASFNAQDISKPDVFFFEKYCSDETQAAFWPEKGYTLTHFLAENEKIRLNQRFVIVNNIHKGDELRRWVSFVDTYEKACYATSPGREHASFILIYDGDNSMSSSSLIKQVDFLPAEIDIYTYNIVNMTEHRLSFFLCRYAAELILLLADDNIEFCGYLSQAGTQLVSSPREAYIATKTMVGDNSELSSEALVDSKVLLAQFKVVFPAIEQMRRSIIEKYYDSIDAILPWENDYSEEKTNPYDMELRDLKYNSRKIGLSDEDYELVDYLRLTRNDLSHNHSLSYDEMLHFSQV